MAVRFHLDEHVDEAIALGLRRRGVDVSTTVEAGLTSATDLQHVEFALRERRVIYTNDQDFLSLRTPHAGVVFSHSGTRSIGEIIEHLVLIDGCMTQEEMKNHIEFF